MKPRDDKREPFATRIARISKDVASRRPTDDDRDDEPLFPPKKGK
jgi:hypothetical protein